MFGNDLLLFAQAKENQMRYVMRVSN